MTLILTVGNSRGVHQSSDYRLIDWRTKAPASDRAGSKQLEAGFKGLHLQLAFTGVAVAAKGSSAQRTIDWLSDELRALPQESNLQDICNALKKRSGAAMRPLGEDGILILVLAVAAIGRPFRVAVISNERWGERPPRAKDHFDVTVRTITKPFHLMSGGGRYSVPQLERYRLMALARAADAPPNQILDTLAAINAIAARNSQGYVSEGCWVGSQVADGQVRRSAMCNVGDHGGSIPLLQGDMDLSDWIKKNFRAAPGKEIRLVQSAGVVVGRGGGTPMPPPDGDPRSFTLSGSSATGLLRSASGQHCASIEVAQLNCPIRARRNQAEAVTVPFVRVQLRGVHPACADFPRPLYPWPTLSPELAVDGAAVPRGCQHTIGYWVERGMHHVEIPKSSRDVRNVAFLGEDEELIIVVSEGTFTWGPSQDGPTATLEANIWWRTRPDGTRG